MYQARGQIFQDHEVAAYWDLDSCPVYRETNLENLSDMLHRALRNQNPQFAITYKNVFGDLSGLTSPQVLTLTHQGFLLHHTPERQWRCDTCIINYPELREPRKIGLPADMCIKTHMLGKALNGTIQPNILLMAGDAEFNVALDYLSKNGKKILLGLTDDAERTCLYNYGDATWRWSRMQAGGGPGWLK